MAIHQMKLVVLIPAYNEEENIERVILGIPRKISGIDEVSVLVINDGSSDKTEELALNGGADKVVTHKYNTGVGAAIITVATKSTGIAKFFIKFIKFNGY